MAELGCFHLIGWLRLVAPVEPFPEPQGCAASTLVAKVTPEFFCRKSLEMVNLGRESLDIPNASSDVLVAPPPLRSRKWRWNIRGREFLERPGFGRESLDMPNFDLENLDTPKFCRESLDISLGPRPGFYFCGIDN